MIAVAVSKTTQTLVFYLLAIIPMVSRLGLISRIAIVVYKTAHAIFYLSAIISMVSRLELVSRIAIVVYKTAHAIISYLSAIIPMVSRVGKHNQEYSQNRIN